MIRSRFIIWAYIVQMAVVVASAESRLPQLVATADSVVVARITGGSNTGQTREIEFTVDRVLKGDLVPGAQIRASFAGLDRAARAAVPPVLETGLIFLNQDGAGSYRLLSAETGELGLRSAYLPLPSTSRPSSTELGSPLESVYAEIVAAIDSRATDEQYLKTVVPKLALSESPLLASALQRWAVNASAKPLRLLAIGCLIGISDGQSVIELKKELASSSASPLATTVATSLNAFQSRDPQAVIALGDIARSSESRKEVQEAAAYALQTIHTSEAVPALRALLDSRHPLVRQFAIGGLSAFALQMRIPENPADAAEARDEVLNPGRRRKIPSPEAPYDTEEVRQFAHFGPFRDPEEENRFVTFSKTWCDRNPALII